MRQSLIARFEQNGGFLRTADSLSAAEKYHLRQLIKEGIISRVKRGLFRLNTSSLVFQEAEVARIVPSGTFCMFTAWAFYELTTHVSPEYHVAIPRNMKIVLPVYPPIKLYFWGMKTVSLGKTKAEMNVPTPSDNSMTDIGKSIHTRLFNYAKKENLAIK